MSTARAGTKPNPYRRTFTRAELSAQATGRKSKLSPEARLAQTANAREAAALRKAKCHLCGEAFDARSRIGRGREVCPDCMARGDAPESS